MLFKNNKSINKGILTGQNINTKTDMTYRCYIGKTKYTGGFHTHLCRPLKIYSKDLASRRVYRIT